MAYIERQEKGGKTYYYLTHSIRNGDTFKKVRVMISDQPLPETELNQRAQQKQTELEGAIKHATNELFFPQTVDAAKVHSKWIVWERPAVPHLITICAEGVILPQKKHFGVHWNALYGFFRNGMVKYVWDAKNMIEGGIFIINHLLKKEYFDQKINEWHRLNKELEQAWQRIESLDFSTLSDKELVKEYGSFNAVLLDWWGLTQVAEFVSYAGEYLLRLLVDNKEFAVITAPSEQSYTTVQEEELMRLAEKRKAGKNIKKELEEHRKKYFWLNNSYFGTNVLPVEYFENEIKKIIDEHINPSAFLQMNEERMKKTMREKQELLAKKQFPDHINRLVCLLDFFCSFQDQRKATSLRAHHSITLVLDEVYRRTGIDKTLLAFSSPYEITDILEKRFDINILQTRRKQCVMTVTEKDGVRLLIGREATLLEHKLLGKESVKNISEFEGMRAQGGKVLGKVVKILDPRKAEDFAIGDILVTTMTSPDFVPLVKKAAAIVTDEGGITCHAAIVAREFNKPCVIGTKIATDVLNTGDLVEVNANHGLVRIVERKKENVLKELYGTLPFKEPTEKILRDIRKEME